jgi:hypothetical protein
MVTFDESTPKLLAIDPATLLTNVVSAARDAAVTFAGKLPKSKVSADLTVYVLSLWEVVLVVLVAVVVDTIVCISLVVLVVLVVLIVLLLLVVWVDVLDPSFAPSFEAT